MKGYLGKIFGFSKKHHKNMKNWVYLPEFKSFLTPFIKQGDYLLDVGCGKGDFLFELNKWKKHLHLFGIDNNLEQLEGIKDKFDQILFADAHELPFKDNKFDATVSFQTIHILHSPKKACEEMERVTRGGGFILIAYSNQNNPINQLNWKECPELKKIDETILKSYFKKSELIKRKDIKFLDLYSLFSSKLYFNKKKIPLAFPLIFDLISLIISRYLKKERYNSYQYLLFQKKR